MKKNIFLYILIVAFLVLFLWHWLDKGSLIAQLNDMQKQKNDMQNQNSQLLLLAGIGPLKSAHLHADVKVYIDGKQVDFSQRKYQLTTSFIHFEENIGDVIHTHASGLTISHMLNSLGMELNKNCLTMEEDRYCNDGNKTPENQEFSGSKNSERIFRKLKFYVNGKSSDEFGNHVIKNLDKYLVSYGDESEEEIQVQLDSVTNLAPKYSK